MLSAFSATMRLRPVARVEQMPVLAGAQLGGPRLGRKTAKAVFRVIHQTLGMPARGRLLIDPEGLAQPFVADFANTAYLDLARRADGYEPEVTALLQRLAPHIAVAYDIGANWGYYSALLATAPGFNGHIEAFEIAPTTTHDFIRMLMETGLTGRVTCHATGLSDRDGTLAIAEGMHSFLTHVAEDGKGRVVPVARLDGLTLPDPDLIKIDVEGHEPQVLRGAAARLTRAKPLIVFENWPHQPEPLDILSGHGYRFLRLVWTGEADGRLDLIPLLREERSRIAEALNLLAVHPARDGALRAAFA
jgi:FkbM family methyltransferase